MSNSDSQTQIRFGSVADRVLFELEVGSEQLVQSDSDQSVYEFTDQETLTQRARQLSRVKDLKRSKMTKKQWRLKRNNLEKGIKRFARSTKGKRFHRKLARWLAMRECAVRVLLVECLVALNSLKTHLSVDLKYSSSIDEESAYSLLFEESMPLLDELEIELRTALLAGSAAKLTDEQTDFLSDLVQR